MTENKYNLEDRTFHFSLNVAEFVSKLPKNQANNIYINQLLRSSSSVGANYIEANEALSKKDFCMRVKICRKEAKESAYWFNLLLQTNEEKFRSGFDSLIDECIQLKKIFSAIIEKSK